MELHEGNVVFKAGNQSYKAFLARPEGPGPFAALIVIQEIFGLTEHIRNVARRLARAGYAALAVDLFSAGFGPLCVFKAIQDMAGETTDHANTRALQAGLDYLAAQPYTDASRLGAIGFCLGGNFAIALADRDKRIKVIAPFYGTMPRLRDAGTLCPVVGSFPQLDYTAAHARKLDAALTQAEIPHDIKIYPRAMHSFANEQLPLYRPDDAADAWARTLAFFAEHL
ncbi:MAG: dienelactone hydrolase family protein [Candidatus Sericytochromatia bacterium]